MADKSKGFGLSEAHELGISALKVGWQPGEFGTLANNHQLLSHMHDVMAGFAQIHHVVHTVDGDTQPNNIADWEMRQYTKVQLNVRKHTKLGELKCERRGGDLWLNGRMVVLCVDPEQRGEAFMTPDQLREWIAKMQAGNEALNANVADFLHANQHLYPPSWSGRSIFFPETVWRVDWGGKSKWQTLPLEMKWEFVRMLSDGPDWLGGVKKMFAGVHGGEKHDIQRFLPPAVPVLTD